MQELLASGARPTELDLPQRPAGVRRVPGERPSTALGAPDDISIASFDDDVIASYLRPGLTTAAIPYEEMGSPGHGDAAQRRRTRTPAGAHAASSSRVDQNCRPLRLGAAEETAVHLTRHSGERRDLPGGTDGATKRPPHSSSRERPTTRVGQPVWTEPPFTRHPGDHRSPRRDLPHRSVASGAQPAPEIPASAEMTGRASAGTTRRTAGTTGRPTQSSGISRALTAHLYFASIPA